MTITTAAHICSVIIIVHIAFMGPEAKSDFGGPEYHEKSSKLHDASEGILHSCREGGGTPAPKAVVWIILSSLLCFSNCFKKNNIRLRLG